MKKTVFERYPKTTLILLWGILGLCSLSLLEFGARLFGLGDVVQYEASPIYGYRPAPNQTLKRFHQAQLSFNELALRATDDWSTTSKKRVLFLGDSVTYGGSYIDNAELFSHKAVEDLSLVSGNAGVNGWGVLNIHALIMQKQFLPADVYVTVLPEGDFYRGLTRLGGQPYWTRPAKGALEELTFYGLYKIFLKKTPSTPLSDADKSITVDIAAKHLKDMDTFLKSKGFKHLIFISPSLSQVKSGKPKDPFVERALANAGLEPIYLLDRFSDKFGDADAFFHDEIHLTQAGHQQWGQWIAHELKSLDKA